MTDLFFHDDKAKAPQDLSFFCACAIFFRDDTQNLSQESLFLHVEVLPTISAASGIRDLSAPFST
jgi:hypothetical protein